MEGIHDDFATFDHPDQGFHQVPKFGFEGPGIGGFPGGMHTTNNFYNNNYTINYNNVENEKKYVSTVVRSDVCKFYQFNENITQNIFIQHPHFTKEHPFPFQNVFVPAQH